MDFKDFLLLFHDLVFHVAVLIIFFFHCRFFLSFVVGAFLLILVIVLVLALVVTKSSIKIRGFLLVI
jgi:hypothetical protein